MPVQNRANDWDVGNVFLVRWRVKFLREVAQSKDAGSSCASCRSSCVIRDVFRVVVAGSEIVFVECRMLCNLVRIAANGQCEYS